MDTAGMLESAESNTLDRMADLAKLVPEWAALRDKLAAVCTKEGAGLGDLERMSDSFAELVWSVQTAIRAEEFGDSKIEWHR